MILFDEVARECFQILRSYNFEVVLFDEDGNAVHEPDEARRFFSQETNLLLSLVEEGDNSAIRLYLGNSTNVAKLQGFITTLRHIAIKFNLMFNVRKYSSEISPKAFSSQYAVKEADSGDAMSLNNKKNSRFGMLELVEGMYGTTRSSYLKLENARMIVRHKTRINEDVIGSRGRNVQAIFVENAAGERFLFPTNILSGARAMTQHVNQGGGFGDVIGESIIHMAEDYAHLASASRHIYGHQGILDESAMDVRHSVRESMLETRKIFERMFRPNGYVTECTKIKEAEATLTETEGGETPGPDGKLIEGLRKELAVEGIDLSDAMLESVGKALHEKLSDDTNARVQAAQDYLERRPDHDLDYIAHRFKVQPYEVAAIVMGKPVVRRVWDEFKAGKIDLMKPVEPAGNPEFKNKTAELAFKLNALVPSVKDDTLSNMLGWVADQFEQHQPPKISQKLHQIAMHAIKAVGMPMDDNLAMNHSAIREYDEWLASYDPSKMFVAEKNDEDDSDETEQLDEDGDNITGEDNLVSKEDKEMAESAEKDKDEDLNEDDFHDDEPSTEHHCPECDAVADPGDEQCGNCGARIVDSSSTGMQEDAPENEMGEEILAEPDANPYHDEGGASIYGMPSDDGSDMEPGHEDSGDLTMADIVLPTNQGQFLRAEVSVHEPGGGHESPDNYINRLRALSGINQTRI